MRRSLISGMCLAVAVVIPFALSAGVASGATTTTTSTTTSTTVAPVLCAPTTDPTATTLPGVGCVVVPTLPTIVTTTTTSVPSAVTTVPEGCALPPTTQAVFVGTVSSVATSSAIFSVTQLRTGSLDGYIVDGSVDVRYGNDAKYLDKGTSYIVGVAQDPVTMKLSSTVRDGAELFGGAQVAGSNVACPEFEAAARTLNIDGTSVDSGIFVRLFDQPWRIALAIVVPPLLVMIALVGLVWYRRGVRR